jgi:putative transposase
MLDENTRTAIALKRFSLLGPVINGQVSNKKAYFSEVAAQQIEMPHYGFNSYSPKTIENWYCRYIRSGLDALKPSIRGDKGNIRKIPFDLKETILEYVNKYPRAPKTVIYDMLLKEEIIKSNTVSLSTFYRFLKVVPKTQLPEEELKDLKRFAHQNINELWQTDVMYGPYIKVGIKKKQTYLFAYIDDASRLITHAEFFYLQNYESLRYSFKEAVLKRGIPQLIYTDNGKIYRSQQFEFICASIGTVLIHAKPFSPNEKGKIERFFLTVRKRFLSTVDPLKLQSIEELNEKFKIWLESDYQRKKHSAHENLSPLEVFISQNDKIKLFKDPGLLKEKFLLRERRKVKHDATFSMNKILYEAPQSFANTEIQVRYEPEWLRSVNIPVLLYKDDKLIGEARQVNFHENAHMKRKSSYKPLKESDIQSKNSEIEIMETETLSEQPISFNNIMGGMHNV